MILFAPGTETRSLHYSHRAVRMLDRTIRFVQTRSAGPRLEWQLQFIRKALAGKPLRSYLRTGKRSKQRRLAL